MFLFKAQFWSETLNESFPLHDSATDILNSTVQTADNRLQLALPCQVATAHWFIQCILCDIPNEWFQILFLFEFINLNS